MPERGEYAFVEELVWRLARSLAGWGFRGAISAFSYSHLSGGKNQRGFSLEFLALFLKDKTVTGPLAENYALRFANLHRYPLEEKALEVGFLDGYAFPGEEVVARGILSLDGGSGCYACRLQIQASLGRERKARIEEAPLVALSLLEEETGSLLEMENTPVGEENGVIFRLKEYREVGRLFLKGQLFPGLFL